jgi:dynein heavy chain
MRSIKRNEPGHKNTLLVGGPGTAKTSTILMVVQKYDNAVMLLKRINFSSATSPRNYQDAIEAEVEKKQVKTYTPPENKNMTVFLDDVSMPLINNWGDQETLEIARQLIEFKGIYFLNKDDVGSFKIIENLQYLAAMNHPGGGRNDIPPRFKRHFFNMNMTSPSQRSVENIYGAILSHLFNPKKYSTNVINMRPFLIDATISIWDAVRRRLLPTPTNSTTVSTLEILQESLVVFAKLSNNLNTKLLQIAQTSKRRSVQNSSLSVSGDMNALEPL